MQDGGSGHSPITVRHNGVLGVEHIYQDNFYLIRILATYISG